MNTLLFKNLILGGVKEAQQLIGIAIPMAGVGWVNMGLIITDTIMIGWLGPNELAAGAIASDFYSIIFYLVSGIMLALGPMIAKALGAGEEDEVRRITRQGFVAVILIALPVSCAVANTGILLSVLGIPESIIALGTGYTKALSMFIVGMMFVALWRNVFAAIGKSKIFLILTILALPLNFIMNLLFMFGFSHVPAFGLTGAGIASVIVASFLAISLGLYAGFHPSMCVYRIYYNIWKVDFEKLKEIFWVGIPLGFSSLAEYGIWLISTIIIGLFGVEALAAHAVALRMAGLVYAIPTSLSQAVSIRVGYAIGDGNDRAAICRAMVVGAALALIGAMLTIAIVVCFNNLIPELFLYGADVQGADVILLASKLLVVLGAIMLMDVPRAIAAGVLRGMQDTRVPLVLFVIGYWMIGFPTGFSLSFLAKIGPIGIWFGILTATVATTGLLMFRLSNRLSELCGINLQHYLLRSEFLLTSVR